MGPQHPPLTLPPWLLGTQNRRGSHPTLHVLSQSSLEAAGPPCGVSVGQPAALLPALSSQTGGKMGPQLPKGAAQGPASLTTSSPEPMVCLLLRPPTTS